MIFHAELMSVQKDSNRRRRVGSAAIKKVKKAGLTFGTTAKALPPDAEARALSFLHGSDVSVLLLVSLGVRQATARYFQRLKTIEIDTSALELLKVAQNTVALCKP